MSLSHSVYRTVEAILGRARTWRIGRWLYTGSRRELLNDPDVDGEYALQRAWVKACQSSSPPKGGFQMADVGANVGAWSANLVEELSRAGVTDYRLWAFEPAPAQRDELSARCAQAVAAGKVLVDPRGVAANPGKAYFNVVGDIGGTNALVSAADEPAQARAVEIDVTTLDAVCAERGVPRLHLVKVDTEGNDFNVILGASGLFDREAIDVLQFEYNWRWVGFGRWLRDVFSFVEGRPYVLGRLTPEGIEVHAAWHPELERYIETNYVIVHRDALGGLQHWRATFDEANTATRVRVR